MMYNIGDILYYVNPFVFTVTQVEIVEIVNDDEDVFYIEADGAFLIEKDLYLTLEEAIFEAIQLLNHFYNKRMKELMEKE